MNFETSDTKHLSINALDILVENQLSAIELLNGTDLSVLNLIDVDVDDKKVLNIGPTLDNGPIAQ